MDSEVNGKPGKEEGAKGPLVAAKGPPRTPSNMKLDLSQITGHPLNQNRSPNVVDDIEQTVLRSRTNSQVVQRSPFSQFDKLKTFKEAQHQKTPLVSIKSPPAAAASPPKRVTSEIVKTQITDPDTIQHSKPTQSQARVQSSGLGSETCPSDSNNNNNHQQDDPSQNNNNNNNFLKIRRSTSLSYTSTLRKRRSMNPGAPEVQDNLEFLSPRPNVKLANFSISPYNGSTLSRRFSLKEQD